MSVGSAAVGSVTWFGLREPFSGLSHLWGVFLSIAGLVLLECLSRGEPWRATSFAIYGASSIILYGCSAVYHLLPAPPHVIDNLRKLDHIGIFFLIAGCYTPVCLVKMQDGWGWSIFGIVWGIAIGGTCAELLWARMPEWFRFVLYILMGWMALIGIGHVAHAIGPVGLGWLIGGGVLYSIGAACYATERPRLWPGIFGAHDVWHCFVLAGSAAHFMLMMTFARPAA